MDVLKGTINFSLKAIYNIVRDLFGTFFRNALSDARLGVGDPSLSLGGQLGRVGESHTVEDIHLVMKE